MKTSTKHLATRAPEQAVPSPASLPASSPASSTPHRRPGNTLPLPARPLRLVVDHDGVTAPDHSARPPARRAVAAVPPEGKTSKAPKAKLASRVGAAIDGAIASVVSKVRKAKTPANPLVCLGPGGEFATAYVGERDGSLTATNPEEFAGLAGTDRGSRNPSSGSTTGSAVRCDTESERAMLALAAIGAATAARLKAQMAAVYRLASLCRSAMSSVSALSPTHRRELPAAKRRKSSKKPAVSSAGLFGPALPALPSPAAAAVSQPAQTPARTPARSPARKPASRAASKSASARTNTRSKSRKAGSVRPEGVPQSSFSTAATQPMLPLAQEVAA